MIFLFGSSEHKYLISITIRMRRLGKRMGGGLGRGSGKSLKSLFKF
jgi:hypothetical protein